MYKGFSSDTLGHMKLRIASEISLGVPRLLLGIITVKSANNSRQHSVVPQLVRGSFASKQKELIKSVAEDHESVALWKFIDKKPHILDVLKTVAQNDGFTYGNTLEDLALYFSVRYEIPILALDLGQVFGDIELCRAGGNEPFRPRSSIKLEHAEVNEVVYRDRAGVVSREWSKYVSQRAALTNDTVDAAWIIETIGDVSLEKLKTILKEMEKAIRTYCGGSIEMAIIGETVTEIDLGVTGTSNINDSEYKPDPRRLAFHQKLLENFARMKKDKGGISMSVKGKDVTKEISAAPAKKEIAPPEEEKELPATPQRSEGGILSPSPEEKELSAPEEEKMLPPATEEKELPAAPEEKLLPSKSETSLIEMLTQKFSKKSPEKITEPVLLLSERLQVATKNAIQKAFPDMPEVNEYEPFVEHAKDASHGDYATNAAMALSKKLGKAPQQVANAIIEQFESPEFLNKLEFAQPGFINFTLDTDWVESQLPQIISKKSVYLKPNLGLDRTVLVEFSAPNIAKPLGIHHLLSTIIGQALYNIYSYLGYKTVAINHIGDWGTQFGKLIVAYKTWGDKKKVEKDPIEELLKLYVQFHDEVEKGTEKDPATGISKGEELDQQARDEFRKLENGDKENAKLWQWFVAMSLKDTQKTYDALGGIHFDKIQGESFYSDKMDDIIVEARKKQILEVGEGGALVVKFENEKYPPFLVQKSDGATLYGTRDLAAAKYRLKTWDPLKVLYVVDVAQSLHFQQLFETAKKLGWTLPEPNNQLIHIPFGRMRFEDEKMSTRKGNIVRLNEVLMEAVERAKKIVAQKSPDVAEKKHADLARIIGIGAVKYNILSQNRTTDIVFQWDKTLSLDGNSAPYIQYTAARANSILKKAQTEKRNDRKKSENQFTLFEAIATSERSEDGIPLTSPDSSNPNAKKPCELILASQLMKFSESVARAASEYRPNIITNYLYETSKLFNTFYHELPVLQAESETARNFRLALTQATKVVLREGLELIGIEVPDEM